MGVSTSGWKHPFFVRKKHAQNLIDFKRNFDKILHDYNINLDKVIFEEGKVPYLELSDIDEDSSED